MPLVNSKNPEETPDNSPANQRREVLSGTEYQQLISAFNSAVDRGFSGDAALSFVVGYSGGLDSHVLLLVAAQWATDHPASSLRAVYIDHGLQAASHEWSGHCARICDDLGVSFQSLKVMVDTASGSSPEDAARKARYRALGDSMERDEILLTAHHADDQAETLLLQLMRGAGVRGLASMPECRQLGAGLHFRPFLTVARDTIFECADKAGLRWIEDPSNAENGFDRNLLRNMVVPLLKDRWPSMAISMSRSAAHCAESVVLNNELALADLGCAVNSAVLPLDPLMDLDRLRRKNAIRVWVERHGFQLPSTAQLDRIDSDLVLGSAESAGAVSFGHAEIRRYGMSLYLASREYFADVRPFCYVWKDTNVPLHIVETGQTLSVTDVDLPWLDQNQALRVSSRVGGERIRLKGHRQSKSVKALLQQNRIPPWQRDRLPFLFIDDCLVGIVGVGFSNRP